MKTRRGYAIPLALLVAGITLTIGTTVAQMATTDLQLANRQYHSERARQIADIGLHALAHQSVPTSALMTNLVAAHPDDAVDLLVFDNRLGDLPSDSGCPVVCPPGYMYWVAQGQARTGTKVLASARLGTLVRPGSAAGSAGAQVRFLEASSGIRYSSVDAAGATQTGLAICATNVTSATDLPGDGFLSISKALTLGVPTGSAFDGKAKVAPGLSNTDVTDLTDSALIDDTGGPYSLSQYAPPSFAHHSGNRVITTPSTLSSGHYGVVEISQGALVNLQGSYHIEQLRLVDVGGRLEVAAGKSARVFIDKVQTVNPPVQPQLELSNDNPAKDLRLDFGPAAASTAPLSIKAIGGGNALVVAPGYRLRVVPDAGDRIQGSFFCEQLKLDYPFGSGSFVYDKSTETPRRLGSGHMQSGPVGPAEVGAMPPYWTLTSKQPL